MIMKLKNQKPGPKGAVEPVKKETYVQIFKMSLVNFYETLLYNVEVIYGHFKVEPKVYQYTNKLFKHVFCMLTFVYIFLGPLCAIIYLCILASFNIIISRMQFYINSNVYLDIRACFPLLH
jgi:hypothetical protein